MQTELSSRVEKLWAMAGIALRHGLVDYGMDGNSKIARISGMSFSFTNDMPVRVRGRSLDIAITHRKPNDDVVFFPGAETVCHFLIGDDEDLSNSHLELMGIERMFSPRKAA